jgi:hypothetical protein
MVWALLAFIGVPLWLCAIAIIILLDRNRTLRKRRGDIPVRVLRPGKSRWARGHAVWVSDVFAWRGSPAAWNEALELIIGAGIRAATPEGRKGLHGLGDRPVIAMLTTDEGQVLQVATSAEHRSDLVGSFANTSGTG